MERPSKLSRSKKGKKRSCSKKRNCRPFPLDHRQLYGRVNRFCPGPSPRRFRASWRDAAPAVSCHFFWILPSRVKFIFPLQSIVLDCASQSQYFSVSEATALGKDMVPKRMFFTKGVGKHRERLTSFELALRDAGIAAQNLVRVSSIFPPN